MFTHGSHDLCCLWESGICTKTIIQEVERIYYKFILLYSVTKTINGHGLIGGPMSRNNNNEELILLSDVLRRSGAAGYAFEHQIKGALGNSSSKPAPAATASGRCVLGQDTSPEFAPVGIVHMTVTCMYV